MQSKYYFVGLALFAVLIFSNNTHACSCLEGESPCETFGSSSAVFVGTATGVKTEPRPQNREEVEKLRRFIDAGGEWTPRMFKFSVELSFLGIEGTEVEVGTGSGGGDCGYDFVPGRRYLVYAYRTKSNRLATSICSATKPYELADPDLKFLGTLSSLPSGVTIRGEIKRQLHNVKRGDAKTVGAVADASLVIEGEAERREIRVDAQGRYRLSGLRPGKYKVTLSLPEELMVHRPQQEVTISDRGCATVDYYVRDNGRISGRVLDADQQPVEKVLMALIDSDGQDIERDYSLLVRTDKEGRYTFDAVPPGRYLVALNLTRFPEPNDPTSGYPRTYYPGVAQTAQASIITLAAGEKLADQDLRLPPRHAASVIKGIVTWADATPVVKAAISFRNVTYNDSNLNFGIQADELGRFEINSYQGQTLVIEARSGRPSDGGPRDQPMERAGPPVRITLSKQSETVKIVITKLR